MSRMWTGVLSLAAVSRTLRVAQTSMTEGWSETMISGARGDDGEIPAIVRADGTNVVMVLEGLQHRVDTAFEDDGVIVQE